MLPGSMFVLEWKCLEYQLVLEEQLLKSMYVIILRVSSPSSTSVMA